MRVSLAWLRDYVDLPQLPEQLAAELTMRGMEVESIDRVGGDLEAFSGVVVGEIVERVQHPNADRLSLCSVRLAPDGEPVAIVCGAPNARVGLRVPVATVGARLPKDGQPLAVKIEKGKIRGEVSNGMICSESELGLVAERSPGIWELSSDAPVGAELATFLRDRSDVVLDLAITANRPDLLSHIGVAREVAALSDDAKLRLPTPELHGHIGGPSTEASVTVTVDDPRGCSRYVARVLRNVTVGPSPSWLAARLEAIGLRPRNIVVDVTNYVMHELGQPLHGFDLDTLSGAAIRVSSLTEPTSFVTLDGKTRLLPVGTLMIGDESKPVAVAGVMGGLETEITDRTTSVLIESAHFDPASIRRTARALGLSSDASYRFERGVDPDLARLAADRACQLIAELTGAEIAPGAVDVDQGRTVREVRLRPARVNRVLGTDLHQERMVGLLERIGLEWRRRDPDGVTFAIPGFRPDLEREIDLIEEVARLHGYDEIPAARTTPLPFLARPARSHEHDRFISRLKTALVGLGLREAITSSLVSDSMVGLMAEGTPVRTLNAISTEMTTLRTSLVPGLLRVVAHNRNHGETELRLFEIGRVYTSGGASDGPVPGFDERERLVIALSGRRHDGWDESAAQTDGLDLKGIVDGLLSKIFLDKSGLVEYVRETGSGEAGLRLDLQGAAAGYLMRAPKSLAEAFDLRAPVFLADLDLAVLARAAEAVELRQQPLPRYPALRRDLAVVVPASVPAGELVRVARDAAGELLRRVEPFDVFTGAALGEANKSIALTFDLRADDRTLTDADADTVLRRVQTALTTEFGALLRDGHDPTADSQATS